MLEFGHVIFATNVGYVHMCWRQFQTHLIHSISDDLRNSEVAKPLVVRGNDVPGRMLGAGRCNSVLVRLHILWPQLALGVVAFADLPMPRRVLEPLREPG